jgi:hypothetical protein
LNKFVTTPAASADSEAKPVKDLNSRLKALINSAPVMIFIKGTPQQVKRNDINHMDVLTDIQIASLWIFSSTCRIVGRTKSKIQLIQHPC